MSKKITIIDYGMGNLYSVQNALRSIGAEPVVTSDAAVIAQAEKILLPGVGAFGDCMANLEKSGLIPVIMDSLHSGKPFLGICLGMQLLFEGSDEAPGVKGLGFFKGQVRLLHTELKIPHMGWNSLHIQNSGRLFKGIPENTYVYFVHSYYLQAEEEEIVKATTQYSTCIHASVEKGNVFACQFHPEKSSRWGLKILENFAALEAGTGKEEA